MIVFTQVLIFGVTDTFFTRWYATTNPNYIRRRRRKQKEIARAESQIKNIEDQLAAQLGSIPVSPNLDGQSELQDIPRFDLNSNDAGDGEGIEIRSIGNRENLDNRETSEISATNLSETDPTTFLATSAILRRRTPRKDDDENFAAGEDIATFENSGAPDAENLENFENFENEGSYDNDPSENPNLNTSTRLLERNELENVERAGGTEKTEETEGSLLDSGAKLWNRVVGNKSVHDLAAGELRTSQEARRGSLPGQLKKTNELRPPTTFSE